MGDFEAVAKAFTTHYYATFDKNRAGLAALYTDQSMLTFEGRERERERTQTVFYLDSFHSNVIQHKGAKFMGKANIHKKLTEGLSFQLKKPLFSPFFVSRALMSCFGFLA